MAFGRLASLLIDIVINTHRFQAQLNQTQQATQNAAVRMQMALGKIGLAAGGILLVNRALTILVDIGKDSVLTFAALEKSIIDIQKVARFDNIDVFADQFIKLGTSIRGVSFSELGEIGGDLARLGVRGGSQGFIEFLEVAAKFKAVTGDIDLRQAGEGLGKILQNFGKELNATEALSMASSINKLADDFAVTSGEILTVTQKLSGFATAVGLTAQETLGLVTLIKQTGISSTVVESSLTRLFTVLEKSPITVAESLGKTGQEIDDFLVQIRTKPIEAVREFFNILNKMPIDQAVQRLVDLELATSRNAVALLNATNRFGDWNKTQQAAIDGAKDVTNLLDKYQLTAQSASAKIDQLKNSWDNFLQSLQSGDSILGNILDKLRFILEFQLKNNPINPGERDPLLQTQGTPQERLAQIRERMAEVEKVLSGQSVKDINALGTGGAIINNFFEGLAEVFTLGNYESLRNFEEKFAKLAEEEKALLDAVITSAVATQKEINDAKTKKRELAEKLADNEYRMVIERAKALKTFNDGAGLFEDEKFEQSIKERFNRLAKLAKGQFNEAAGGTAEIYRQIDLMKERRILEEIGLHYQQEFNKQFKEEIDLRVQRLNDLERTRNDAIGMLNPGGNIGGIINRAIQLDSIFKEMREKDIHKDGDFFRTRDALLSSVFDSQGGIGSPRIRGLTEAYKEAITDEKSERIDKEQLGVLKDLLELQLQDSDIKEKTLDAIKEINTGVI